MRRALAAATVIVAAAACADQTLDNEVRPPPSAATDAGLVDAGPSPLDAGARDTIRVATFNVHRFFDTVCDTGQCGATDFEAVSSVAQFQKQTFDLAQGIQSIDADVIALEEVEDQTCLDALTAQLTAIGAGYPIAHLGETGSPGSVDVAVLARRGTLGAIRTHREQSLTRPDGSRTSFSRELLEVRLAFDNVPVVMFAAHFRSQVDDDAGRRFAEASATHDIMAAVAAELPNALVVLGGDLNDRPGSDALNALEGGGGLVRVARDLPAEEQGTYLYNGTRDALDHIYVVSGQAGRYVPQSAHVARDGNRGLAGSDHAALSAAFALR